MHDTRIFRHGKIAEADYLERLPRRSACNLSRDAWEYIAALCRTYIETVSGLPTVAWAMGILSVPPGGIAAAELI